MQTNQNSEIWKVQKNTGTMFVAEIVGTFVLLFVGCMGAIALPFPPHPLITGLGFGLTVNFVVLMVGHLSGAHLNPAITIGAVLQGSKTISTGVVYILGQLIGATAGYGLLQIIIPTEIFKNKYLELGVCVTTVHPSLSTVQALLIEMLCTSFLLCAVCATWDPQCAHLSDSVAIKFGLAVAVLSFTAGPYTGCSMNPARSFAPALWNNSWKNHWIYWVGPILGAVLGSFIYQLMSWGKQK